MDDAGQEEDWRTQYGRIQDRRIQDWENAGPEGCRSGRFRRGGYRTRRMQNRENAGHEDAGQDAEMRLWDRE